MTQSTQKTDWIPLDDAARLEGLGYFTFQKRLKRRRIVLMNHDGDSRRKLVPLAALSGKAQEQWLREQVSLALNPLSPQATLPEHRPNSTGGQAIVPVPESSLGTLAQPLLPFAHPTAAQAALIGIPKRFQFFVDKWLVFMAEVQNGNWKRTEGYVVNGCAIRTRQDYIRAMAPQYKTSETDFYRKQRALKEILKDPAIPEGKKWAAWAQTLIPKPRPGRSATSFFVQPENLWQFGKLREFYLTQAQLSVRAAHRLLLDEIDARQRAHGLGHIYDRPTESQCRVALSKIAAPVITLAREGEKAYADRHAPFISRQPPNHSADIVGTDQKYLDILCRDHAWNVGRIWTVNFVDVASERWLGGSFGPVLSGDLVMEAAAMMLERCLPGAVQMDLGKEFTGDRFLGGTFTISGERYYAEAVGLWERLGVSVIKAIGRNPKTKPIEGWHRSLRRFEQAWPTWTGPNTKVRPERLKKIERQVELFKQHKAPAPLVPTIEQVIKGFLWWCENRWNARTRGRGRYRQGMTPDECWNVKRPEDGHRRLTASQIDYYTADRRYIKVSRGGQINLTFHGQTIEYVASELFWEQGRDEKVEVLISRRDLSQVKVLYPIPGGTGECVAMRKELSSWEQESRQTVNLRMRCTATIKRALKHGLKTVDAATYLLAEAPGMPTAELVAEAQQSKLIDARQAFGAPEAGAVSVPRADRLRTSGDVARQMLELAEEQG